MYQSIAQTVTVLYRKNQQISKIKVLHLHFNASNKNPLIIDKRIFTVTKVLQFVSLIFYLIFHLITH